ncbi:hypothetical protein WIS52_30110 [Pseudonocardia nematodicida]|uniref:Syndecan 1 n=1 Tax=Pseudonocardia nematodicida TaxID=1206997 RepID=A0ABV1KJV8_9PSEU
MTSDLVLRADGATMAELRTAAALRWQRPLLTAELATQACARAVADGDDRHWLRAAGWLLDGHAAGGDGRDVAASLLDGLTGRVRADEPPVPVPSRPPGGAMIFGEAGARLRVGLAAVAQADGELDTARALVADLPESGPDEEPGLLLLDRLAVEVRCALAEPPGPELERLRGEVERCGARLGGEASALADLVVGSVHRAGRDHDAAVACALRGLERLGWSPERTTARPLSAHLAASLLSQWITALLDAGRDPLRAVAAASAHRDTPGAGRQGVLLRLTLARAGAGGADHAARALSEAAAGAETAGVPALVAACRTAQSELFEGSGRYREALGAMRAAVEADQLDRGRGRRFRQAVGALEPAGGTGAFRRSPRPRTVEHRPEGEDHRPVTEHSRSAPAMTALPSSADPAVPPTGTAVNGAGPAGGASAEPGAGSRNGTAHRTDDRPRNGTGEVAVTQRIVLGANGAETRLRGVVGSGEDVATQGGAGADVAATGRILRGFRGPDESGVGPGGSEGARAAISDDAGTGGTSGARAGHGAPAGASGMRSSRPGGSDIDPDDPLGVAGLLPAGGGAEPHRDGPDPASGDRPTAGDPGAADRPEDDLTGAEDGDRDGAADRPPARWDETGTGSPLADALVAELRVRAAGADDPLTGPLSAAPAPVPAPGAPVERGPGRAHDGEPPPRTRPGGGAEDCAPGRELGSTGSARSADSGAGDGGTDPGAGQSAGEQERAIVVDLVDPSGNPVPADVAGGALQEIAVRSRRLVPPSGTTDTDSDAVRISLPDADRVTVLLWARSLATHLADRVRRGGLPDDTSLRLRAVGPHGAEGDPVVRELTGPDEPAPVAGPATEEPSSVATLADAGRGRRRRATGEDAGDRTGGTTSALAAAGVTVRPGSGGRRRAADRADGAGRDLPGPDGETGDGRLDGTRPDPADAPARTRTGTEEATGEQRPGDVRPDSTGPRDVRSGVDSTVSIRTDDARSGVDLSASIRSGALRSGAGSSGSDGAASDQSDVDSTMKIARRTAGHDAEQREDSAEPPRRRARRRSAERGDERGAERPDERGADRGDGRGAERGDERSADGGVDATGRLPRRAGVASVTAVPTAAVPPAGGSAGGTTPGAATPDPDERAEPGTAAAPETGSAGTSDASGTAASAPSPETGGPSDDATGASDDPTTIPEDMGLADLLAGALAAYREI